MTRAGRPQPGTGKVAVVTGAGSGIGRALAVGLARRGCRLALGDLNASGLAATRMRAEALGAPVFESVVDVADRAAVGTFATQVAGEFGVVHQVYNNAGIAGGRRLLDASYEELDLVLLVNLGGVLNGTKEFLPHLIASGDGHLVNISSLNGLLAQPGLTAYCASKFGVRGFTEAVRAEMLAARHPVAVTVVHPGGVRTDIANASLALARAHGETITERDRRRVAFYNRRLLRMDPTDAAETILRGVEAGRPRIVVGASARRIDRLTRLLPNAGPALTAWFDRRL